MLHRVRRPSPDQVSRHQALPFIPLLSRVQQPSRLWEETLNINYLPLSNPPLLSLPLLPICNPKAHLLLHHLRGPRRRTQRKRPRNKGPITTRTSRQPRMRLLESSSSNLTRERLSAVVRHLSSWVGTSVTKIPSWRRRCGFSPRWTERLSWHGRQHLYLWLTAVPRIG